MNTPVVTTGGSKAEVQKPARDAKPPTAATARTEARAAELTADRAALSARSQAAAARALTDEAPEERSEGARGRLGRIDAPPVSAEAADHLARETSRRIVLQPAAAARAQANCDGASVLAMLQ